MCGRYAAQRSADELAEEMEAGLTDEARELEPSSNVAPTDPVRIVLDRASTDPRSAGARSRELHVARWGLLPSWSKGPRARGAPMFNARLETVAEKAAFAASLGSRRCLVPADGYYEWRVNDAESVRAGAPPKTPFFIHDPSGASLAFAGLYAWWRDPERADDDPARWVLSTTILTTAARDGLEAIHDREPVVLDRSRFAAWLDPAATGTADALAVLTGPGPELVWHEVGPRVGSVRNDDPGLMDPV